MIHHGELPQKSRELPGKSGKFPRGCFEFQEALKGDILKGDI